MARLRDGSTTTDPRLDRLAEFDERSKDHPVSAVLSAAPLRTKTWTLPERVRLDQGQQGSCVGHGWSHSFLTNPAPKRDGSIDHAFAVRFYNECQRVDEWPGEEPTYSGTSNLAGAKTAKAHGFCDAYKWCFSIDEVCQALAYVGPVVVATDWRADMWQPSDSGLIESVGGTIEGGHCYMLRGLVLKRFREPVFRLTNSWGPSWGLGGEAFIRVADMEKLLKDGGDACVPVGKRRGQ